MNVVIGADHRGFEHKEFIKKHTQIVGHVISWIDVGAYDAQMSDYPLFAQHVCRTIREGAADYGILLCGSGVGMAVAANRYRGIYAALAWNELVARFSREHDNANVLVLPSDFITPEQSLAMINAWLSASFLGGRHQRRIDEIDAMGGI